MSDEDRKIDKEIIALEKKIREIQSQYDKLYRTKSKKIESIKEKENTLKELDRESRHCSKKRNELQDKLYRKEICNA